MSDDNKVVDLFSDFATDTKAEQDGVWEPYNDKVSFLVARAHNKAYDRMIVKEFQKHRRLLDSKTDAAAAKSEEIMIQVMAKTILLGWQGDFNWQGQLMGPYTAEKAVQMLKIKDFRAWVDGISQDFERYKVEKAEEDAGK